MISKNDKKYLEKLINKISKQKNKSINQYPLLEKGFTTNDIMKGIEVLLSSKITMSEITKKFENYFSKFVGCKYSLMVNSGSSANLLAANALINPKKRKIESRRSIYNTCYLLVNFIMAFNSMWIKTKIFRC